MPSLGADMDAGTLVEWMKKPGDTIQRGEIIAAVETAKGVIEVEVFEDGILDQVFFQPGQEVPVGQVLATICAAGEYQAEKPPLAAVPIMTPVPAVVVEIAKPDGPTAAVAEVPCAASPDRLGRCASRPWRGAWLPTWGWI